MPRADSSSIAGETVACCHLQNQGYFAYFGMFAVDPTSQRQGLGKALPAEAERIAAAHWGADEMHAGRLGESLPAGGCRVRVNAGCR